MAIMSEFDFTDLVLLVGTNPLPNYVVGSFFLGEKAKGNCSVERIWLVYSGKTKKYAENLEKEFQKINSVKVEKQSLSSESSAITIRKEFKDGILSKLKDKRIHLNYTGGTKSMSVHTYVSLFKESLQERGELNIHANYSYLDARSFCIMDDSQENPITGDLRKEVSVSLEALLTLHRFVRVNNVDMYKDSLKPVIQEIEKIVQNRKAYEINFWKFTRDPNNTNNLIEKTEQLQDIAGNITETQKAILSKLPDNLKVYFTDGKVNKTLADVQVRYAIEFLDGKWLEQYVEYIIHKYINNITLQIDTGWEIRDPDWNKAKHPDETYKIKFELDVVAVYGYQFIGISCTTSSKRPICKSKGFEIIRRSQQIGGDEVRSILVTNLRPDKRDPKDDKIYPEDLQEELEIDNGGKGNFLVLGSKDLTPKILTKKIEDFIKK